MSTVEWFDQPQPFLDAAEAWLAREPVVNTVIASYTHRLARGWSEHTVPEGQPCWWAVVRDESDQVVGAAMGTAPFRPYPPYLLPMPAAAAVALAQEVSQRGITIEGVNGALPAIETFAAETVRLNGGRWEVVERTRLFDLPRLVEPAPVPGRLRSATADDLDLCVAWFGEFHRDVDLVAGRDPGPHGSETADPRDVLERVTAGVVYLWEVDGDIVHLTAANPPSYGVARVGPVYTPSEHRGRGYASAAVAEVSRDILAAGHRACLFTDQANPTSNHVYEALGYRPLVDMANVRVTPG
ncbi:MAG: GNAT family N-acetyltransferase [Nocardioides sp.]